MDPPEAVTRLMPQLVMAVGIGEREGDLVIHKTLTGQTVHTVLRTPVRFSNPHHSLCGTATAPESADQHSLQCDRYPPKPISPVDRILGVQLAAGAYIRRGLDQDHAIPIEVIPYGARLTTLVGPDNDDDARAGIPETALSLLQMTAMLPDEQHSRFVDQDYALHMDVGSYSRISRPRCIHRPLYSSYHLSLELTEHEADRFIERVSRVGLEVRARVDREIMTC
jgi:hypothetical protein